MKMKRSSIITVIFIMLLSFGIQFVAPVISDANASDRSLQYGYFNNKYYDGTGNKVIRGGIPSWVNTKSEFIGFVKNLFNSPEDNYNGRNNKIGAAYIIQTMRGPDSSGNWDHSYPDANDITDWENKINNSEITVNWSEFYSGKINTKTSLDNDDNPKDVIEYDTGSNNTYESIIFYKGSTRLYVVKRACGNPLGNLTGLPNSGTYLLTPYLNVNGATSGYTIIEPGAPFPVTPTIKNSGTIRSPSGTFNLTKTITNPNRPGSTTSGSGTFAAGETLNVLAYNESNTDYPPGTNICFVLSVRPHSTNDSGTVNSSTVCVIIAKKPKVQVWGGDLWVGRQFSGVSGGLANVQTSQSKKGGNTFGSWVEYGIFASGSIRGMGSGSAFAATTGLAGVVSDCDFGTLSFTNTPSSATSCTGAPGTIGNFRNTPLIRDISSRYPTDSSTRTIGDGSISGRDGLYKAVGNISISASTIPPNRTVIINATGRRVTISGNIDYSNATLHNISEIPQVIIIADTIVINGGVQRVDAWLIAKNSSGTGSIYTCDTVGDTISKCNQQLRINGPVMTQKLYLRRTYGSGTGNAAGDPAEIFNLRPDAYLWGVGQAARSGKIRTVYTTELPPRF